MKKPNKELARLRYELDMLRSSRPVRFIQFSKDIIREPLVSKYRLLKTAPALIKRAETPSPEDYLRSQSYPGDIGRTSPLNLFTNINVLLIGRRTVAEDLFGPTCNIVDIEDSLYERFHNCDALQIIAIDAGSYQSAKHKTKVLAVKFTQIIVYYDNSSDRDRVVKDLSSTNQPISTIQYRFDKQNLGTRAFIDIYKLAPSSNQHTADFTIKYANSLDDLEESSPKHLTIISESMIDDLDKDRAAKPIQTLLEFIGNSNPVIVKSSRKVDWLPDELMYVSDKNQDRAITKLREDFELERYSIICSRSVILRFNSLPAAANTLHALGISTDRKPEPPKITVLAATRRGDQLPHLVEQINKQTIKPHEVMLLLHGASKSDVDKAKRLVGKLNNYKVVPCDETMLFGEVLNRGLDMSTGDYITKMDDDDYYGPEHFADLYAAALQSQADFVGKWNNWVYFADTNETISWLPEYSDIYSSHIPGGTILVRSELLKTLRFGLVRRAIDSELYRRAISRDATLYVTHRYNYVRVRGNDHTYNARDAEYRARSDNYTVKGMPLGKLFC